MNQKSNSNNKCGHVGVSYDAKRNKYRAYADIGGEKFKLGWCGTLEDAINKRETFKEMLTCSNNKLLSYLQFRYSEYDSQTIEEILIEAVCKYADSGKTLYVLARDIGKNYRKKGYDTSTIMFAIKSNPIIYEMVYNGKKKKQVRDEYHVQHEYIVKLLKDIDKLREDAIEL